MSDADGNSRVKFHGFGMTDVRYMRMFPWYSVDSASWALVAGFGNVFYLLDDGRYGILGVSSESPSRKMAKRKHIERLPKVEQAMFIQLFTKHGFTLEQLQSGAKFRRPWNIVMCQKIADLITGEDVKHKVSQEFFV
jgi:hypothetical protein